MSKKKDLLSLKKILSEYLKVYSPKHKFYAKNIKALFEGLVEKELIQTVDGKPKLSQFKKAFGKAAKSTKLTLIITNALDEHNLGKYFYSPDTGKSRTKKAKTEPDTSRTFDTEFVDDKAESPISEEISRVFMVGDTFLYQGPDRKLNEIEYKKYHKLTNNISQAIKDKEALIQAKDFLKEVKMYTKEQDRIDKALKLYHQVVTGIIDRYSPTRNFTTDTPTEKIEKELSKIIKSKKDIVSKLEIIKPQIQKKIEIREITQEWKLKNLITQLEARQQLLANPVMAVQEELKNVVEELSEVIHLRQQLTNLLEYLEEKRSSIQDHFDLFQVWSPPKGEGEVELFEEQDDIDTYGNKREGLASRDFKNLVNNLAMHEHLMELYSNMAPTDRLVQRISELRKQLREIQNTFWKTQEPDTAKYTSKNPTDINKFKRGTPTNAGHIIDVHETHLKADAILKEVKGGIEQAVNACAKALVDTNLLIDYNKNIIKQAERTKRTVVSDTIRLQRAERRLFKQAVKQNILTAEEAKQREERQKRILKSIRTTEFPKRSEYKVKSKKKEAKAVVMTTFRGQGERKLTRADFATRKEYLEYLKKYDPELYEIESLYEMD